MNHSIWDTEGQSCRDIAILDLTKHEDSASHLTCGARVCPEDPGSTSS